MQEAAPARHSRHLPRQADQHADRPTAVAMVEEVIDLSTGLGIALLPLLLTAVPGLLLFFALPAVLLLAVAAVPAIVIGTIAVPPYLLARSVLRRRARRNEAPTR